MKKIDLDSMTEAELHMLNREVVQRLEFYSSVRRKSELMAFRVGDRVAFDSDLGSVTGTVVRVNQKTASIEGDDGRGWRVSPKFLQKITDSPNAHRDTQANLFQFPTSKRN